MVAKPIRKPQGYSQQVGSIGMPIRFNFDRVACEVESTSHMFEKPYALLYYIMRRYNMRCHAALYYRPGKGCGTIYPGS